MSWRDDPYGNGAREPEHKVTVIVPVFRYAFQMHGGEAGIYETTASTPEAAGRELWKLYGSSVCAIARVNQ